MKFLTLTHEQSVEYLKVFEEYVIHWENWDSVMAKKMRSFLANTKILMKQELVFATETIERLKNPTGTAQELINGPVYQLLRKQIRDEIFTEMASIADAIAKEKGQKGSRMARELREHIKS